MSNENIDPIEAQNAENSAPTAQPTQAREGASLGEAFARVIRQPTFMIVAGVLLLAAVGLNFAVRTMQLHFKKEPLELAHALGTISPRFGSWVQVSQDQPLDKEMQDVLGTDKYVFREYVNETATDVSVANRFTNKTAEERRIEVTVLPGVDPGPKGTTIRTVLVGQSWANAATPRVPRASTARSVSAVTTRAASGLSASSRRPRGGSPVAADGCCAGWGFGEVGSCGSGRGEAIRNGTSTG